MTKARKGIDITLSELLALRHPAQRLSLNALKQSQQYKIGQHRSPFHGRGMEFSEVRHYQPGDDIRAIDWKITARTNKPHTKLFQEERLQEVYLVVDRSNGMQFGTDQAFKSVIASQVAALLAFTATNQGDAVGGIVIEDSGIREIAAGAKTQHALQLCHALSYEGSQAHMSVNTKASDGLTLALRHLFAAAKLHSMVIICSDFSPLTPELRNALSVLRSRHQVLAVMIHDRLEGELPDAGILNFSDAEQKLSLDTSNPQQRAAYQRHFAQSQQTRRDFFGQSAIPWLQLDTSHAWLNTLEDTLVARSHVSP